MRTWTYWSNRNPWPSWVEGVAMPKSSPDISKEPKSQGNFQIKSDVNYLRTVLMYMFISSIVCSLLPFFASWLQSSKCIDYRILWSRLRFLAQNKPRYCYYQTSAGFISVSRVLTDVRYRCWTSVVFTTRTKLWREATQRSPFHRILKKSKIWKFFGKTPSRSLWETLRSSCSRPSASPQPTILTGVDIHSRLRNWVERWGCSKNW